MNAVSSLSPEAGSVSAVRLKLRVLAGRNEGAEHSLPPDRKVMIGHSYENDIVLRNAQTRGTALHLTPRGRLAVLEIVAGEIMVLGRTLIAGERLTLEPYVPVRVAGFVIAIGEDDAARWDAARDIAQEDPLEALEGCEAAPRTTFAERVELRTEDARGRYLGTLASPLALGLAAALMLTLAAGAFFGTSALAGVGPSPRQVQSELTQLGFGGLYVEQGAGGKELSIIGLLANDDELLRLRQWADAEHPDIALGVATLASAAEAADNLLAAQNVDAAVRPNGMDSLLIETEFLPKDRQAELEALLRQDLPRVRNFAFSASPDRGESDLAYFFNAPGYGAASFVSGDPGYIVTEDGTRWFAGASLPTGHTILEISENSVTVERDGMRDTLKM